MASRLLYGSRPNKPRDQEEDRGRRPTGLSRRTSAASTMSNTSKIPTYTGPPIPRGRGQEKQATGIPRQASSTRSANRDQYEARTGDARDVLTGLTRPFKQPSMSARLFGLGIRQETPPRPSTAKSEPAPRRRLRRKSSSNDQRGQYTRSESTRSSHEDHWVASSFDSTSMPEDYSDPFPGSILGMTVPEVPSLTSHTSNLPPVRSEQATSSSRMATYQSRHVTPKISTADLPPPTPSFAANSSSSSRYSDSPGPFSRTSTPTSISSHSPALPQPLKSAARTRQQSPTRSRPPVTRRKLGAVPSAIPPVKTQGLAALPESLTSSSSSSTVRDAGVSEIQGHSEQPNKRNALNEPAPTPPLRLSSKRLPRPSNDRNATSDSKPTISQQVKSVPSSRPRTAPESSRLPGPTGGPQPSIPQSRPTPPPRPSREGTPVLSAYSDSSPIIQSNLTRLETTGHKRRESAEKNVISPADDTKNAQNSRTGLSRSPSNVSSASRKPSRLPSPSPSQTSNGSVPTLSNDQPSIRTERVPNTLKKDPSPSTAGSTKSQSRFGLFSRRVKSPFEPGSAPSDALTKKGPAAGTGHEGYGKYARRGRTSSVSTNASRGRSTSTENSQTRSTRRPTSGRKDSVTSQNESDLDAFLRERLSPVVITGGGATPDDHSGGTRAYRTSSEVSSVAMRSSGASFPSIAASTTTSASGGNVSFNGEGDSFPLQSSQFVEREQHAFYRRDPSQGAKPSLALRRSFHRSQLFGEASPAKIPAPINTKVLEPSPSINSYETLPSAAPKTDSSLYPSKEFSEGREGKWLISKKPSKPTKSPKRWNFFHRTQRSPKKERMDYQNDLLDDLDDGSDVPVMISKFSDTRPLAHYAMIENSDQEGSESLEGLLQEIENDMRSKADEETQSPKNGTTRQHGYSMLLPSPPSLPDSATREQRPASPKVALRVMEPESEPVVTRINQTLPGGHSRLAQVGRIPRVISKRDRQHKPPPTSFSRPFSKRPPTRDISAASQDVRTIQESPKTISTGEKLQLRPWEVYNVSSSAPQTFSNDSAIGEFTKEFLVFSPRKGSEVSVSSSSQAASVAAVTAVPPAPDSVLSEDEVWNEYDELLDHVTSPARVSTTSTSRETCGGARNVPIESGLFPFGNLVCPPQTNEDREYVSHQPPPPNRRLPEIPPAISLPSPRYSPGPLSTPISVSNILAGYANRSSELTSKHHSVSSSHYSTDISLSGSASNRSSSRSIRYTEATVPDTHGITVREKSLRYNALTTSRWLSFDRILFSPAHFEIKNNRQDRILVLDGLGNNDWSSYCAWTYPDATVYNLSASGPFSSKGRDSNIWTPASNHRQIHHEGIAHPFPFPKSFFAAVVLRFPVASSEQAYRNAVSECKRVLRPGGYLEMTMIDIDMMNMGDLARRAVRGLKVRMQTAFPDVCLKPSSDELSKIVGRKGFENLKSCVVGVPVANTLSSPSSSATVSLSEKDLSFTAPINQNAKKQDEGIAIHIAQVGRLWYNKCYESNLVYGDVLAESILDDSSLLQECKERETGFRLLICCAQKPEGARRRTVSV
ncbi:hypothetical protein MMC09_001408 [Bachmanniomyces sp. S44760]|nr:hypothetical protein [Bachmanniomyces sp. S44760]